MVLARLLFKSKRRLALKIFNKRYHLPTERLGGRYGGWVIPLNFLNANSVCYLVGAGEDITFDLSIKKKFNSEVHIFDPTPKAIEHFNKIKSSISKGNPFFTSNGELYDIDAQLFSNITMHHFGIWDEATTIKFYAPKNKNHISHSAINLQKTNTYFEAKVDRLKNVMVKLNHQKIDLLKLDIEGAEYKVIDTIIEDQLPIDVICIEFDETHSPLDSNALYRVKNAIQKLKSFDYLLIDLDHAFNMTFVKKEVYNSLIKNSSNQH